MKTKIAILASIAFMLLFGTNQVQAQSGKRAARKQECKIQLSEVEKEQLKSARLEFAKATKDSRNELNELKAHQSTLMSSENLDENKIYANIDRMTALQKQIMKERTEMRLSSCKFLGDNQGKFHHACADRDGRRGHGMHKGHGMKQGRGHMHKNAKSGVCNQGFGHGLNALDLSDAQQEKMKAMKLAHLKASQNLREEMQELRLKQKHLFNDEQPNKKEIMSNGDRISAIQNQLAKQRVKNQKEIRNILDEDQLVLFLAKPHKMQKHRKARMHKRF